MTEAELIKAQADLIAAQQNFISMVCPGNASASQAAAIPAKNPADGTGPKETTLKEYSETFMETLKSTARESTYQNYTWLLNKHILPALGDTELCRIDNLCLQKFADEKLKNYAKKSVRDLVGLVKTILNEAYINGTAEPKKFMIKYPKSENTDYRTLTEEEFKKLEEYLLSQEKPHCIGELIMLETGMRIGEMCGLKWDDIDTENKIIKIKRTVQRIYKDNEKTTEINIGSTKTKAGERTVPINKCVSKYLKTHSRDGSIYVASGRENPTEPRTHRQYHARLMKKIGIDYINPHGLRHTFATRAIRHGVDPKTVSAILGHSNSNITLNIYTSVTDDMLRDGIEKMSV